MFGLRIYSILTMRWNLFPLSGVKLNRQLESNAKLVIIRTILADDKAHKTEQ